MNIDYTGKSVLVVGGTSGIGAGIVAAFAAAGATVTATGATQKEVDAAPRNASLHVLDVRDNAAVKAFVGALPSLDVVVNCAGIAEGTGDGVADAGGAADDDDGLVRVEFSGPVGHGKAAFI